MNARALLQAVLVLATLVSGWAVWRLRSQTPPPAFVGPPRADYSLDNYQMVALDPQGGESFYAQGPVLVRDPYTHTITLQEPRLRVPGADGGHWSARAKEGWVSPKGEELRLSKDVVLDGYSADGGRLARMETERLSLFPDGNQVRTDAPVTITRPNSILRGRGLDADLDTRRMRLLSEVSLRHATSFR